MTAVFRNPAGIYLAAIGAALALSLSFPNVSNTQEPEEVSRAKRCSIAELERMLKEQGSDCPGSFAPFTGSEHVEKEASEIDEAPDSGAIEVQSGVVPLAPPCPFTASGDYPHKSGSDVSAHGWWDASDPTDCPLTANVVVTIQGFWCDELGCRWLTAASKTGKIGAKNVSGERVTARRTCARNDLVGFKNIVQVSVVGSGSKTFNGPPINVQCYPN